MLCPECHTLVADRDIQQFDPHVNDESRDTYGANYWFDHQTRDLRLPDIHSRCRTDLADRCVHWLRSLLEFKLPPAKVLEIGCGHGGFVALLRQAGYDAVGLELSPSIVRLASDTFRVPVLTGPVEDQSIEPRSLDAIVMMDVLEHLPQPLATLKRCMELLKPDGILLIQTPAYPENVSLRQLQVENHRFQTMLEPGEHLYLFSKAGVSALFGRLGVGNVQFIPAVFDFYDMSLVASAGELQSISAERQSAALARSVSGRFVQALLDIDERRLNLLEKYRELRSISRLSVG